MTFNVDMLVKLSCFDESNLHRTLQWVNNAEIAGPFGLDRRFTLKEHREWYKYVQSDVYQQVWAIEAIGYGHIGNIGLKFIDKQHRKAELWIYIGEAAMQGRGLAKQAVELLLETAFYQLGLRKIYLHVSPSNEPALKLYHATGFTHEGVLKQELEEQGGYTDMFRMAYTISQWQQKNNLGPRVALMQPTFFSWLGYFELFDQADFFVFLDDFQFSRQSWGQRNRLFLSSGVPTMVTLPIHHPQKLQATFLEIAPAHLPHWSRKLYASLRQTYGKAPYSDNIFPLLEKWLMTPYTNIADMLIDFTLSVAKYLGLQTSTARSSSLDYDRTTTRSLKVASMLKEIDAAVYYSPIGSLQYMKEDGVFPLNIPTYFQNHNPLPYQQVSSKEFVPLLSVVDALFNMSPSQVRKTLRGTREWLVWDKAVSMHLTLNT